MEKDLKPKRLQFNIGEIVQFGLVKAKVVENKEQHCGSCLFRNYCVALIDAPYTVAMDTFLGPCSLGRNDGKSIRFEEIND